jgi:hypothetical protein
LPAGEHGFGERKVDRIVERRKKSARNRFVGTAVEWPEPAVTLDTSVPSYVSH